MKHAVLYAHVEELLAIHSQLGVAYEDKHRIVIAGTLAFEAAPKGEDPISDSFQIQIHIPGQYPARLPKTKETEGKIDRSYGHFLEGDYLCLALPVEERRRFSDTPTLLGYVNNLVIPYLYNYRIWELTGESPFGELAHYAPGILQYYREQLEVESDLVVLQALTMLIESGYRGHRSCPCGSGRKVRDCHAVPLRRLHDHHTKTTLENDFAAVLMHIFDQDNGKGGVIVPDELRGRITRLLQRCRS